MKISVIVICNFDYILIYFFNVYNYILQFIYTVFHLYLDHLNLVQLIV